MTDFFTMPGGVVNLQSEDGIANLGGTERSSMAYVQPPGNTKDDGGTVRFNTIDWERRAKVAAEGVAGLEAAARHLRKVGTSNYFGDLVEGIEVFNRLVALVTSAHSTLTENVDSLSVLARECKSAGEGLAEADLSSSRELKA
ncbi:hypothetical protein [Gordonia jacobaea]|uniref:ESX-1 secretion-associated protein n=1 Tax=Gordonia jacobaea TaxID=122202 RepID=A0ABR5IBD3_9ACTN|nr:hypothetical protein [Gordonia jacobaea]KNA90928.1 hypothetical protein ABW18_11365 [Gordonia jacobaea]